jgi:hypothetical protein
VARFVLSTRKTGKTSRTNIHGSQMYAATCEYVDQYGVKWHGLIQLPDELPHTPGQTVLVRYLPSDPTVMREEYYILTAREPGKWVFVALPWIANSLLCALIYADAQKRKKRAVRAGRAAFPY